MNIRQQLLRYATQRSSLGAVANATQWLTSFAPYGLLEADFVKTSQASFCA